MSKPVCFGFILQTQKEQEEKEELGRVIRDSFHPHHKDRLQPGSFAMSIPGSAGAGMLMEPSPPHSMDLKQEEVLTKLLWAVKALRNCSWCTNTFVFAIRSDKLDERVLIEPVNQTRSQIPPKAGRNVMHVASMSAFLHQHQNQMKCSCK